MDTIFAGYVTPRPYPVTGLTTKLWIDAVPTRRVRFSDLWLTQDGIKIEVLFTTDDLNHSWSGDKYPHVVLWHGKHYLEDGNHRVVRAALRGYRSANCRVFEHALSVV